MGSETKNDVPSVMGSPDSVRIARLECDVRRSTFSEIVLLRSLNKYLLLDGLGTYLFSRDNDGGLVIINASGHFNGAQTMTADLAFVDGVVASLEMTEMHGTWHGMTDVAIIHSCDRGSLRVVTPEDTPDGVRDALIKDVKKGIRLAQF